MIKVKDVITLALELLGRTDVTQAEESGSLSDEQSRVLSTLLHCYNSVEDELARSYFAVTASETAESEDGRFYYVNFAHTPVKILSVKSGSKPVKYRLTPQYIQTNAAQAEIEYTYAPSSKTLEDDGEFDGIAVSARMMAYGVTSEYLLIQGAFEESQSFESKYRLAINQARKLSPERRYIPPRGWV